MDNVIRERRAVTEAVERVQQRAQRGDLAWTYQEHIPRWSYPATRNWYSELPNGKTIILSRHSPAMLAGDEYTLWICSANDHNMGYVLDYDQYNDLRQVIQKAARRGALDL